MIIGAGQYGTLSKEIAESMGMFEQIDFLDDKNEKAVAKSGEYKMFVSDYSCAFVAVGDNSYRLQMIKKLKDAGYEIAVLVSPKAYVSPSARLEEGTIVEPMAVVQAEARISVGCLVCSGVVVKHNAYVGEGCYLDCNSIVQAGVFVPAKTKVSASTAYV